MRVNIYIRDEDKELWEALENKSAFVSDALRGTPKEISPPKVKQESQENKEEPKWDIPKEVSDNFTEMNYEKNAAERIMRKING